MKQRQKSTTEAAVKKNLKRRQQQTADFPARRAGMELIQTTQSL